MQISSNIFTIVPTSSNCLQNTLYIHSQTFGSELTKLKGFNVKHTIMCVFQLHVHINLNMNYSHNVMARVQ